MCLKIDNNILTRKRTRFHSKLHENPNNRKAGVKVLTGFYHGCEFLRIHKYDRRMKMSQSKQDGSTPSLSERGGFFQYHL